MYLRVLISLIAFMVVVQNTCPQGWASKTAFATCGKEKQSSHCPMHERKQPKQNGLDDAKRSISNVKQVFVLYIVRPDNSYEILGRASHLVLVSRLTLTAIFSDPPLRPPIPSLFT